MANHLENAKDIDFITKTAIERDPNKRKVKPVDTHQSSILDLNLEEESSDDSDFRIEDHAEISDDNDDDSANSNDDDSNDNDSDDDDNDSELDRLELKNLNLQNELSISDVIKQANKNRTFNEKDLELLICSGCLGDQSDGINEIVECDNCGVTVHEACYGISDTASFISTDSLSPTAPWFCDPCKAGITNPICELCPNLGGIYKETDVGKWVHLICALYVPGVAFGEVDKLTNVTLFEMPYSKWGAKNCSLCLDDRYARTGICIGCDAGMCKTYFHVTCAQREGFLSEAHSEEVDQADPFYAHCKLHSDKTLVKRRKKNYLALQLRTHYKRLQYEQNVIDQNERIRIEKKLTKQKLHLLNHKSIRPPPWVPTQKMPRLLTTSASACRKLLRKAELMGINISTLEMQEAQTNALLDVRKKWHISPAFSVEFIAYYLDRNERLKIMKETLEKLLENNRNLLEEQQNLRAKYDELLKTNSEESKKNIDLRQVIHKYHSAILSACPTKNLPNIEDLGKSPPTIRNTQLMMVPTAAALKMGVGFPLNNISGVVGRTDRVLSCHALKDDSSTLMLNECGICRQKHNQHLLTKCDTCHLFYHLNCLNPPLTRLPKKSKLYGWQCSECDKTSDSDVEVKTPRRSKSRYSREPKTDEDSDKKKRTPKLKIKQMEPRKIDNMLVSQSIQFEENGIQHQQVEQPQIINEINVGHKSGKKRRREKHKNRYSPDPIIGKIITKEHKRKRKKKCFDNDDNVDNIPHPRITIKIKPIPLPAGEVASESNPQCFYVPNENNDNIPPLPPPPPPPIKKSITLEKIKSPRLSVTKLETIESVASFIICDVCQTECVVNNSVKCDECQKSYHFTCLDPPVKKSPKRRGYSWHCADCDPTGSE